MKNKTYVLAILIVGCSGIQARSQNGICDPKAPAAPCIDQPRRDARQITGKASPGAGIDLLLDEKKVQSKMAGADGTFAFDVSPLVLCHSVRVNQTTAPVGAAGPAMVGTENPTEVYFQDLASDQTSVDVAECPKGTALHLLVQNAALHQKLKDLNLQDGDRLDVSIGQDKDRKDVLQVATVKVVPLTRAYRLWTLFTTASIFFGLIWGITKFHPLNLTVGVDGRYSNSQFQMVLWFGLAIITYLATLWLRVHMLGWDFLCQVSIPQNLLLLSGMSAVTFGAAKGITASKVQDATDAGISNPKGTGQSDILNDLTHNDQGSLDLGDTQMLVITLIAACTYFLLVFHFLGSLEWRAAVNLPDVDTTILASFGLGHGAYLTKKAVGEVGKD